MTENEAIYVLEDFEKQAYLNLDGIHQTNVGRTACHMAIKVLEEIQKYRAIGTVEECREAMEKQNPQKPHIWGDGTGDDGEIIYDMYDCPNCGKSYELDYQEYKHCPVCGQALDRRDIDD